MLSRTAGVTTLDDWDRAYSLAWQWWIYADPVAGENTLRRDRPAMAAQAPYETGIPPFDDDDARDMQDIIAIILVIAAAYALGLLFRVAKRGAARRRPRRVARAHGGGGAAGAR